MNQALTYGDVRLNYDLSAPQQRFRDAGFEAAFEEPSALLPTQSPCGFNRRSPDFQTRSHGLSSMYLSNEPEFVQTTHSPNHSNGNLKGQC